MINRKFLELINKDIDQEISEKEKNLLEEYLKSHPEAEALHRELQLTEAALDNLPETEPSENLKKRILNSIDFNRYARKKSPAGENLVFSLFTGRPLAFSFALGIIAGIIILSVIALNTDLFKSSENNNIYGTIGLSNSELVETVPVNVYGVSGKIDILQSPDNYGFQVELDSFEDFRLYLEYNTEDLQVKDFTAATDNVLLQTEEGYIEITAPDRHLYTLILSAGDSGPGDVTLKLVKNGNSFFEHSVFLK
jgi:hypothetical protein